MKGRSPETLGYKSMGGKRKCLLPLAKATNCIPHFLLNPKLKTVCNCLLKFGAAMKSCLVVS